MARVAAQGNGALRVVGPGNERVPVLNEGGASLRLKVVSRRGAAVEASAWHSDSAGVAAVDARSGEVRPVSTGFATIYAQTARGEAKCFVAVMRVTAQTGGQAQGDTKSDASGKLYLSDPVHHVIVRASGRTSERWVGSADRPGFEDGEGTQARFAEPSGLALDLSAQGGLYVADSRNHCVRKVGFDGRVGSQQASSVVVGHAEIEGVMTGAGPFPLSEMRLRGPQGVVSTGGNLFISDTGNHCVWYADVARGRVWLVAGRPGDPELRDGTGDAARFASPSGIAINTRGDLLAVADTGNDRVRLVRVRRLEDGGVVGQVSTLGVASSAKTAAVEKWAEVDKQEDEIAFDAPRSVSIDGVENVYVVDARTAAVVTRPEERMPVVVALAEEGSLGQAVSLTLEGTRALVLDAAAARIEDSVREVRVGAPEITRATPEVVGLAGGEEVVVEGRNFAPESEVTIGGSVAIDYEVESATRVRLRVPVQTAPGSRTVTVVTRGGLGQRAVEVRAKALGALAVGHITTVAGGIPYIGDGGAAADASVGPTAVARDAAGNLYIADPLHNRVRRVDGQTGRITTVAGTGEEGYDGDDKPATSARLSYPRGVAVDGAGNLLIAEVLSNRIRRVDTTGRITTVAGTGDLGFDGDDGPAVAARLNYPAAIAVDGAGNLLIADYGNSRIRRVDGQTGRITTVAGTGEEGYDGDGGLATSARLNFPEGVGVDGAGNLFIADTFNHRVRRVDGQTGRITTVAGTGEEGYDGDDKPATSARLYWPAAVAVDASGNLLIADSQNFRVRRVDASGRITTVAGTGEEGYDGDDKPATSARLTSPDGVAVDAAGNLYIADLSGYRIRRVDVTGRITTVAGTGQIGYDGDDKPATSARLNYAADVAVDGAGNLYIADESNHRVRRVDGQTGRITTVAGTGLRGYDGDGGLATSARLNSPEGVAVDGAGNLFIADSQNFRVRRVDASGRITTVAGTGGYGYDGDDQPATSARLTTPSGVAADASGNLFIADRFTSRIRMVDAAGRITTVAGTGVRGYNGDDRPATSAWLNWPRGVAVDGAGNLYIADTDNHRVRRVDASGRITTVAGTGRGGYDGDGKPATSAQLHFPRGVAVDGAGILYIADTDNERIRRVNASGRITTVAGTGERGYDGDGGPATDARFDAPSGVAADAAGNLLIADELNNAIRAVKGPLPGGGGGAAPRIDRAFFSAAKQKLKIVGSGFGAAGAVVAINGADASAAIRRHTDSRLVLRGTAEQLGLRSGTNEIVVTAGGRSSNAFVLTL